MNHYRKSVENDQNLSVIVIINQVVTGCGKSLIVKVQLRDVKEDD